MITREKRTFSPCRRTHSMQEILQQQTGCTGCDGRQQQSVCAYAVTRIEGPDQDNAQDGSRAMSKGAEVFKKRSDIRRNRLGKYESGLVGIQYDDGEHGSEHQ